MLKRVGLLGGTFDPPHIGHFLIAQEALHACELDEVWFIPVQTPPHKERDTLTSGEDRVAMLAAGIEDEPRFAIKDIELRREGKSYTIDTVRELKVLHPETAFFFIIGGDMVETLSSWRHIDELRTLVTFVAFVRPGAQIDRTEANVDVVDFEAWPISSTMIRTRLKHGRPIQYFVPFGVARTIEERHLYVDDE
ncbi:nicotinate-nucleotide adenylyltransferase [Shouchella lonarensis]|uniref:Probable nicotinate-nucleotide adenylyltransferase n=1 Tax=Shouchella lonarensis TaxID=1464122 RepID=A0A1G6KFE6_9BACI|nr:nicotinate-nucleotide adenylyltransferase [Shouchella lonarensis]SDC29822.1 nicotinate-nucleotide adenylyltransferase [Shouchella lonarensis]